jgi:hypothetical protein
MTFQFFIPNMAESLEEKGMVTQHLRMCEDWPLVGKDDGCTSLYLHLAQTSA